MMKTITTPIIYLVPLAMLWWATKAVIGFFQPVFMPQVASLFIFLTSAASWIFLIAPRIDSWVGAKPSASSVAK
jgi:hypothetical protein